MSYLDSIPLYHTVRRTIVVPVAGGILVPPDPSRVALIWIPVSVGTYYVQPAPAVTGGSGWIISQSNYVPPIKLADWGPIVQDAWHGYATGAPITTTVIEITYYPEEC